ncbi:uncharacterized protein LOC129926016 [Biomphalaria glabrata]|uniref:Uncharacterized protein LOC129924402 n=1 Tax=Biomphalaria glabrata TaxID=6526 RepID=A0A9W3A9A2_BIOGL|nr:uncharacterized protein LOC129924402 [Biomphalaria glabrata]XP_055883729.1 uncharacterized protein LOC129926016 [Biomphalaria glabrata]
MDESSKERYLKKISEINNIDPYTLKASQCIKDNDLLPSLCYPDLFTYLVLQQSAYTKDEFKAYKSLAAYNQFLDGWVQEVMAFKPHNCLNTVVLAKVLHSQRLAERVLQPWIVINQEGIIVSAHCSCIAGLGESCTHVAATLFMLEANTRLKESKTVTGVSSYWMIPSGLKKVLPTKISEIDFTSSKTKKVKFDTLVDNTTSKNTNSKAIKSKETIKLTSHSFNTFIESLHNDSCNSATLSVLPHYQESFLNKVKYPVQIISFRNENYCNVTFNQLMDYCQTIDINFSDEEAKRVEKATRGQSDSKLWFSMREGRITASKVYDVCHTSIKKPSITCLNSIISYQGCKATKAMQYGTENEKNAKLEYIANMQNHINFKLKQCGLFIHSSYPFLGASPDAIVKCSCCGKGCVEIKCPLSLSTGCKQISDLLGEANFCLDTVNETIQLKRHHRYYYQVQTQIFISCSEFCDFVVWSPFEFFKERIIPDHELWCKILGTSKNFFMNCVLPEVVGLYFTRNKEIEPPTKTKHDDNILLDRSNTLASATPIWCICKGKDEGKMIKCDNSQCSIKWFHFECIHLKRAPKGKWFCSECKTLPDCVIKRKKAKSIVNLNDK